jgi:hypothetical protein
MNRTTLEELLQTDIKPLVRFESTVCGEDVEANEMAARKEVRQITRRQPRLIVGHSHVRPTIPVRPGSNAVRVGDGFQCHGRGGCHWFDRRL